MRVNEKETMRIGIDARFWGPSGTGLGKYIEKLILNLENIDNQNEYFIFLRRENFNLFKPTNPYFHKVLADSRWYSFSEQIFFPYVLVKQKLNLMHFGHFNVPVLFALFSPLIFCPYVITIHDLIKHEFGTAISTTRSPVIHKIKHMIYRFVFAIAVNRAQKVLVPSCWVKKILINKFKLPTERIRVTYEAGGEEFKKQINPTIISQTLKKYKLAKPFLIYVGNVYSYKNLGKLFAALKILKNQPEWKELKLVIGCARNIFLEKLLSQMKQEKLEEDVCVPGFIATEDLICLYQSAEAYVFPSLSEGFGIPPLDAMTSGLPVVSSNASCLPEIYGDAAHYFDPFDEKDLAQKIEDVLISKKLRQELIEKGFQRAKMFSWKKMAQETLSVYREVK